MLRLFTPSFDDNGMGKSGKTIVRSSTEAYNDIRDLENVVWKEAFYEP
ncbi:hypothetical protein HMPREF9412_4994 [Paenibacillus sp. HGF5]|nr:hypothetical protein HMPREF9412_4994 [Paenibacillus sp. HGF5]